MTDIELDVIIEDSPDDRMLECAVSAGSGCIVTGDIDLLRRGRYLAIGVLPFLIF